MTWRIDQGDCLDLLRGLADASVDAVVTDPPYELGFMGKAWDASGIAYRVDLWREVLRVLKPGGHLLAFGGTRTYHRMACAIEDAGFEIRDSIHWIYGSGFPKSLDVSKAIDKSAGAEREVVGHWTPTGTARPSRHGGGHGAARTTSADHNYEASKDVTLSITAPATESARRWSGWGTALKPAHEPVVMARKPLDGTVAQNVQRHGTGAINVDGGRIGSASDIPSVRGIRTAEESAMHYGSGIRRAGDLVEWSPGAGRWPANIILGCACAAEHEVGCPVREMDEQSGERPSGGGNKNSSNRANGTTLGHGLGKGNGMGIGADTGGASRFFYCAKASRSEREAGLREAGLREAVVGTLAGGGIGANDPVSERFTKRAANTHPTVKPIALMRYLVRLVTPSKGLVLDPFSGSGTTGCAAVVEGFRFLGFEREAEYAAIARARIEHRGGPSEDAPKREAELTIERQLSLF